jgi:hypothetical protein
VRNIVWISGVLFALVLVAQISAATGASGRSARAVAPRLLSETGLYKRGTLSIDPRNRPYSPQYPLWSDGAGKARWVHLPPGARIDATNIDAWVFPIGTKFWKEFSFNGRRVETRFLWRAGERGWIFASYKWNGDQTDATIASADGEPGVAEVAAGHMHGIPSVEDCHACHDAASAEVLGFTALQLSTDRDPNAIHGEPLTAGMVTLQTLVDEGVLKATRTDLISTPPRIAAETPRTRAVLGYLSTNCGVCHNADSSLADLGVLLKQPSYPSGPNRALETTIDRQGIWRIPGKETDSKRVAPGSPELSALLYRLKSRRPSSQMPPLGTVLPDREAIDAVTRWIGEDLAER